MFRQNGSRYCWDMEAGMVGNEVSSGGRSSNADRGEECGSYLQWEPHINGKALNWGGPWSDTLEPGPDPSSCFAES